MASICRTMRRNIVRNSKIDFSFRIGNGIAAQKIIDRERQAKRQMKAK